MVPLSSWTLGQRRRNGRSMKINQLTQLLKPTASVYEESFTTAQQVPPARSAGVLLVTVDCCFDKTARVAKPLYRLTESNCAHIIMNKNIPYVDDSTIDSNEIENVLQHLVLCLHQCPLHRMNSAEVICDISCSKSSCSDETNNFSPAARLLNLLHFDHCGCTRRIGIILKRDEFFSLGHS